MTEKQPILTVEDVIDLVLLFEANGIDLVIDGGWGVDALMGEQSRPHSDLDIVVRDQDVPRIRALLEEKGYTDVPRDDTCFYNFVLGDERGHAVDIHTYTFDEQGNNVYGLDYLPDMLTGQGSIAGHPVKCIPPDWMVKFHSGYELDENDYHDVRLLCERFGLSIPTEYDCFIHPCS
jgi:lincosamide nucleotidyltransferase A/C/D/E